MTASQLATMLRAKKTGRGKWMSKCPAHADKHPSLAIAEGKKGVVIRCMSQGCDTKAILGALGLTWSDLFDSKPTREVRERVSEEGYLEALEKRLGIIDVLHRLEPAHQRYWSKAIEGCEQDIIRLRMKLYPDEQLYGRLRGTRKGKAQIVGDVWEMVRDDFPVRRK